MEKMKAKNDNRTRILCTKKKIEETKKIILDTVESLLEESVSDDHLIHCCKNLSQSDYSDVIEERNILNLCGYPVCSQTVKLPAQKYQIHYSAKKVYDITGRKCFCSNKCYKASNFLKSQLLEIPIWYQEKPVKVTLLQDFHNRGSAGEEIIMHDKLTMKDVNTQKGNPLAADCKKLLLDEIAQYAADFKDKLVIKEKEIVLYEEDTPVSTDQECGNISSIVSFNNTKVLNSKLAKSGASSCYSDQDESETLSESSSSDDDEKYFLNTKEEQYPSHKLMPSVPAKAVRAPVLIAPLPEKTITANTVLISDEFLEKLHGIFREWITLDTYEFLLSDKGLSPADIQELFSKRETSFVQDKDPIELRESYLKICMKLDKMEEEEKEFENKLIEEAETEELTESTDVVDETCELTPEQKMTLFFKTDGEPSNPGDKNTKPKRRRKKKSQTSKGNESTKSISIRPRLPQKINEVPTQQENDPILPMVDSVSQTVLRKQVVISNLRISFLDLLPLVELHYKNISDDIRMLVSTFRLSPTNILFRAAEWKTIALVLFRMLKEKFSENYCSDSIYEQLLQKSALCGYLNLKYVDNLISSLICFEKKV